MKVTLGVVPEIHGEICCRVNWRKVILYTKARIKSNRWMELPAMAGTGKIDIWPSEADCIPQLTDQCHVNR